MCIRKYIIEDTLSLDYNYLYKCILGLFFDAVRCTILFHRDLERKQMDPFKSLYRLSKRDVSSISYVLTSTRTRTSPSSSSYLYSHILMLRFFFFFYIVYSTAVSISCREIIITGANYLIYPYIHTPKINIIIIILILNCFFFFFSKTRSWTLKYLFIKYFINATFNDY